MIIKTFIKNEKGKIEFTEEELSKLLDEIYEDGYNTGKGQEMYQYKTPGWWNFRSPSWTYVTNPHIVKYDTTCTTSTDDNTINIKGEAICD